jgi:hypothetical protein
MAKMKMMGLSCKCSKPDPADPCGHSDTSEGCPRHDPRSEGECPSCGGVLYECGGDFLLCDECGDEWDPDVIAAVEDL